jgi:hypothetical protein
VTSLARRPLFWVAYAVVALLALALAVRLFPEAIPIVNLDVKLGRDDALAKALQVAVERKLAPSNPRAAARFNHDGTAQNYIELEGGGKPAFGALTRGALYAPYWWEVRVFSPGVIDESTIRFRPDGTLYGFTRRVAETYVRNAATKALAPDAARALAESRAQAEWGIELAPYALIEQSQSTQDNGRVDHSFVYERPEHIGEATVRLRLVVAGDELVGVTPFMKIPERFNRRFEELRSTNNLIAGVAGIAALLLYGVGGVLLGSLWLARRHWLVWRPSLVAGLCVGALLAAALLAAAPAGWFGVETTESVVTYWSKRIGGAVLVLVLGGIALGAVFMAAESLSRRAFPHHPQLWRVWSRESGASRAILGRTLGGYLFVPIEVALVAAFYYATNSWLGWWQPSEVLTDPNVLGSAIPALAPIANSLQAGFLEECAFRAIPLALGALIGARYGRRTLGIAIALVLQALVFGAAHANYPGFPPYSRPVELFLPALVWGLIYLRYGLVPTIVLHATFDLVLMSIPVFLLDVPGAWIQQVLVIVAGLIPLVVVLWRIVQGHGLHEMPVGAWNGAWEPSARAEEAAAEAAHAGADQRYAARFQRALPVLGIAGLAAWAWLAPFHADAPAPRLDRAAAIKAAEDALAARNVVPGPQWKRLAVVRSAQDDADDWNRHKFVWREAGAARYRELVGGPLAPPVWDVRFATFTGDIAERAEEWRVSVGTNGEIRSMRHALPESRPGAALSRVAARVIAERELRARFAAEPADLRPFSAQESRKPARVDWTFVWGDPRVAVGKDGEVRYVVALAGDDVSAWGRFVNVPESWMRAEEERTNRAQIAAIAAGFLFVAAVVAGLVLAIIAWIRHRCDVRALLTVFALSVVLTLAAAGNGVPLIAMQLSTAEPLWSQWLIRVLGTVAAGLFAALVSGLLAGIGSWHARTSPRVPLAIRLPPWAVAMSAALLVTGAKTAVAAVATRSAPLWPALPQSQLSPLAGALIAGLNLVPSAGVALFVVYLAARVTAGFTRRAWLAVALIVLLQCAIALSQAGGQYVGGLIAGVAAGLTAAAVLWWLIRYDPRTVPAYIVTELVAAAAVRAAQTGSVQSWVGFAIQALAAVAGAWLVMRYLEQPLAAAAKPPPAQDPAAVSTPTTS